MKKRLLAIERIPNILKYVLIQLIIVKGILPLLKKIPINFYPIRLKYIMKRQKQKAIPIFLFPGKVRLGREQATNKRNLLKVILENMILFIFTS